jgi:hypothetical protein
MAPPTPPPPAIKAGPVAPVAATLLPGFHRGPWFGASEQVGEEWDAEGVHVLWNAPAAPDATKPTRLLIYATPNGNTAAQTLGSALAAGTDWHFDIQHVAAQVRRLRELGPGENVVVACVEPEGRSWPAWRRQRNEATVGGAGDAHIRALIADLRARCGDPAARVTLVGHSGGGSLVFGALDSGDALPEGVDRMALLDANYAYSDDPAYRHGDKLLAWLKGDPARRLIVIAYDDREITLDGKKVVGADGGTFRATRRMADRLGRDRKLTESKTGDIVTTTDGAAGQVLLRVHANPQNKILHTVLVGEMNGVLEALTWGTLLQGKWGTFGAGPRAYARWVQPAAGIPPRPAAAPGGAAVMARVAALPPAAREEALAAEVLAGNVPDFWRRFVPVTVRAGEHTATVEAAPDYLAVGSDADFVRVPLTPQTAQRIADAFGYALPTRKLADDLYRAAAVRPEPRPLTEEREAAPTFVRHNALIEEQRRADGHPLGALVAGIKKDVVVTNRLAEKPGRVAIYGWHRPDGTPIQPLSTVHRDTYVDYSHAIRLLRRTVTVDGKPRDLCDALRDPALAPLFSDEGPIARPVY